MNDELNVLQQNPLSIDEIASTDTTVLRKHLSQALVWTAKTLTYLGAIWAELERRGEDLSALRSGIAQYLPAIAHGKLSADLVVKYAGQKMLLNAISGLSVEEQNRLLEQGSTTVITINEDGDVVKEEKPLDRFSAIDIRFVFSDEGIRTESQQIALRQKALKVRSKPHRLLRKAEADLDRNAIVIGSSAISAEKVLPALSEIYGFDVEELIKNKVTSLKALNSFEGKVK